MPLNETGTHTVLSAFEAMEAEPEEKNRVVSGGDDGSDGNGSDGEVRSAVNSATDADDGAERPSDAAPDAVPDAELATAGTMPMPRIAGSAAAPTMKMPRIPDGVDTAARTVPIPNLGTESPDVIANAVRDAAAEAMTMRMPAVKDAVPGEPGFVEAPTEPLPVLREGDDAGDEGSEFDEVAEVDDAAEAAETEAAATADAGSADDAGDSDDSDDDRADNAADEHDADSDSDSDSGSDGPSADGSTYVAVADSAYPTDPPKPSVLAEAATVSFRRMPSSELVLPETVAEVVAVVDAASKAIAAADARQVAETAAATPVEAVPPPVLDLRQPAQPAPVDGVLDLLAPVLNRPLLEVERPELPPAPDLMALHRAEFELDFAELPYVAAGDEPPIPTRFGPGLAVLPHIEFPV